MGRLLTGRLYLNELEKKVNVNLAGDSDLRHNLAGGGLFKKIIMVKGYVNQ
jgi:hypothetical protein